MRDGGYPNGEHAVVVPLHRDSLHQRRPSAGQCQFRPGLLLQVSLDYSDRAISLSHLSQSVVWCIGKPLSSSITSYSSTSITHNYSINIHPPTSSHCSASRLQSQAPSSADAAGQGQFCQVVEPEPEEEEAAYTNRTGLYASSDIRQGQVLFLAAGKSKFEV